MQNVNKEDLRSVDLRYQKAKTVESGSGNQEIT
jgi:hypothetical protein